MNSYYCIISGPGAPVSDIVAIGALNDGSARAALDRLLPQWLGYETVTLYDGERVVAVVTNPSLGFAARPRDLLDIAA